MKKLLSLLLVATFLISSQLKASQVFLEWTEFSIGFYHAILNPEQDHYISNGWSDDYNKKQGFVVGKHFLYKFGCRPIGTKLNTPFIKFSEFMETCRSYKGSTYVKENQERYNNHCKQGADEIAELLGVSVSVDD